MALRANSQTGAPYLSTAPVNLAGGNPISVWLSYDGTVLSITLTDLVTHATFVTNATVNIAGIIGSNTAYVGITGADGGISSTQVITNFQFASLTSLACGTAGADSVSLTWPNSAAGLVPQQTPQPGSPWTTLPGPVLLDTNGNNQLLVPTLPGPKFYRLATP
jgi:hypothetical protein